LSEDSENPQQANVIVIAPGVGLHESKLTFKFVRARGPGGQNVNKVSSAAELRVRLVDLESAMPLDAVARLKELAASRITSEGELLFFADDSRTQEQNRADAIRRLRELIVQALVRPKVRKKRKPSRAAKERRFQAKKHRGEIKKGRSGWKE
jgi:ribosome-associated protein